MDERLGCNQTVAGKKCDQPPAYRFTWPGRDEALICEEHAKKALGVSEAMGFHLQLIPLAVVVQVLKPVPFAASIDIADDGETVAHGKPR